MDGTQELNVGLGSWPRRRAMLSPQRTAVVFDGAEVTYAEFDRRVAAVSTALVNRGVREGERVAYWGGNHIALLEFLFATLRIGAVAVLVNARLAPREAQHILTDSDARLLAHGAEQREGVEQILASVPAEAAIDVDEPGGSNAWKAMHDDAEKAAEVARSLSDPAILMYTSGTTGLPKGAVLTHGNLFFNDVNVLIETDIRPDEICLAAAPLYHIAGLNGLVLPTFLKGGTIVLHRRVDDRAILADIAEQRVTSMFAVPSMLDSLAQNDGFEAADLNSLRTVIVGGAPVPERLLRRWAARDVAVQQGYGLTETAPAVLKLAAEDGVTRAGSAGRPQFLVDVRLADPGGEIVPEGDIGELQTRGPNVISEYWRNQVATEAAFQDGWFCTGDAASQDSDGYYRIRDRYKDMFVSGGENVYPAEIESALLDLPGIQEAAVVGVADERWGEVGKAFLVVAEGAHLDVDDLREQLRGSLSRYKIPKHFEFISSMPRTSTGKLLKRNLGN